MTRITINILGFVLVVLPIAPVIALAQSRDFNDVTRRVVILNSTDPYLPAFIALDDAMRKAIRANSKVPVEYYAETLDMYRFPRKLFDEDVVTLLRKKYQNLKVDVVVAAATPALDFALRHRTEIWPGAEIVFHSVPDKYLREHKLDQHTIGVPIKLDFNRTIDLALRLLPETQQITVIAGTADSDQKLLSSAQAALERYKEKLDIQYLVGLSLVDTIAAVKALPSDAVVFYLTVFRDGTSLPHVPRNVLKRLAAVSRAPIFGVFETYLGNGIAAGSIVSYGAQGKLAGELVARVLNGEPPSTIRVQSPVKSDCIADWRQLQHWQLDEYLLPPNCEIRFREVTLWDRYHIHFLVALAVILAQAALIVVLMLHRRRLRLAQAELQDEYDRRAQAETMTTRLRARLARFSKERSLGSMATTIAHEINQPLIAIQNYAQAAKRRLETNIDDKPKLVELFGKIEGQAQRAGTITQRVRSLLSSNEPRLTPTPLSPLLEEVISMMEPECENRGCQFTYESAGNLPEVLTDALQVQLVTVNLLSNAMRSVCASKENSRQISIDVRTLKKSQEVQVSILDTGDGVPPDRIGDIFGSLYSDTGTGMGMGLAICRDIIDAHGGRIWYEPNPEGGAIFRFTLRTEET